MTRQLQPKVGVLLATRGLVMRAYRENKPVNADSFMDIAVKAEDIGLDSIWVGDSLVSKPRLEPVAAMSALGARTSQIRIGSAVMLPTLRHPVTLAHSLATADVISGGRLYLGVGVGGAFTKEQSNDWASVGVDPATRASRLTETIQILKRLWTENNVSFDGRHFKLDNVSIQPKPNQENGIPLLLATHYRTGSEAQFLRAARYADGIMGITDSPEEYQEACRRVMMLASEEGRDSSNIERFFYLTVNINNDKNLASKEADDFLISYYGVRHWGERWGPWGTPNEIVRKMQEYIEAGAQHLIVRFASWDQREQFDRFAKEVLPHFK